MLRLILLYLTLYYGKNFCLSHDNPPEVDTPLGKVRGFWKTSLDGRKYAAFEGIPYAKPPVEELRFETAQPVPPWSGVWEANKVHTCLQRGILEPVIEGEEDCLYLNVYKPAEFMDSANKLDVVVVIHGGAFMIGSGHVMARSDFFMDRDIVLVTINYRVGILGFLSTEDSVIPGNNGMKDQVLALKWVKDNIASFGGNPHSITLAGLSAGGASVHLHYLSPLSKGLFHRGLSQSGSALNPWVIKENALQNARKLAAIVDCPTESTVDLKKCLKQRPALDLLEQLKHFYGYGLLPLTPFAPVVEKGGEEPFLDRNPYLLLKEGKVLDVPWITSHTTDDGLLPSAFLWNELDQIAKKWAEIAHYLMDYNDTLSESRRATVSREILNYYLAPGEHINKKNFGKLTQAFTDRYFTIPGEVAAKLQAKVTKSPVYYYIFNYGGGENKGVEFFTNSSEVEGVAHGEDGIYLQGFFAIKPFSGKDKRMRNAFHDMLYTFASTGKPSFDGTDKWQPTGSKELTYLNVTGPRNMKLQTVLNMASSDFWNRLGLLENDNLVVFVKDEL